MNQPADIVRYYTGAGLDYGAWSPDYQMHFGYWRWGMSPLAREPMLREMNRQVYARLALAPGQPARVLDLGCGLGAVSRQLAAEHPELSIDAVSLVPWQIEQARRLAERDRVAGRITFQQLDYCKTGFAPASFAGAWALEAACHAPGLGKEALVAEAARVLAPGARFVVVDGFLKRPDRHGRVFEACLARMYRGWALETFPGLPQLSSALTAAGFEDIQVDDFSWRIAPSVGHVPWVTTRFLVERRLAGERLDQVRRDHVVACVLSMLVGLARWRFGYFAVSAQRS